AEVIKIEHPTRGDDTRAWGPPYAKHIQASGTESQGESAYFISVNRNKKSIGLSFAEQSGQEILHKLAKDCDVLVENYLPDTLKKYQMDFQTINKINPSLIYASITGYGQTGPYRKRAGYDVMVEAEMGLMHITGSRDGPPVKVGVAVTDLTTGLYTSNSIMAALLARARSGKGQHIDVALSDCQVATLSNIASSALISGQPDSGRWGTSHPSIVPYRGFKTQDGDILLGGGNDRLFGVLCDKLGKPEWKTDERFNTNSRRVANRITLEALIEAETRTRTTAQWLELLDESGMPYAAVNDIQATLSHEHGRLDSMACRSWNVLMSLEVLARNMVKEVEHPSYGSMKLVNTPVKYSHSEPSIRIAPPTLGQHTNEILTDILGMSDAEISDLKGRGVVSNMNAPNMSSTTEESDWEVKIIPKPRQPIAPIRNGGPSKSQPRHTHKPVTLQPILPRTSIPRTNGPGQSVFSVSAPGNHRSQTPVNQLPFPDPKQFVNHPTPPPSAPSSTFPVAPVNPAVARVIHENAFSLPHPTTTSLPSPRTPQPPPPQPYQPQQQQQQPQQEQQQQPAPTPMDIAPEHATPPSRSVRGVKRGPARGRGSRKAKVKVETPDTGDVSIIASTPSGGRGSARGRGRGGRVNRGGRPRGSRAGTSSGRGVKRKREEEDEKNDSDVSEIITPLPTQSRSGRKIIQPNNFSPIVIDLEAKAPAAATITRVKPPPANDEVRETAKVKGKKRASGPGEASVCKNCTRGHSPASNMIVFCDGCNGAWHQFCHDPPIPREVIRIEEQEWFCADCLVLREEKAHTEGKVSAETLSLVEVCPSSPTHDIQKQPFKLSSLQKRRYFQSLSPANLVSLLLHATILHPDLPIFATPSGGPLPERTKKPITYFVDPTAPVEEEDESYDLYPDSEVLPYPKAGNGVPLPLEKDCLDLLIDEDVGVYSHLNQISCSEGPVKLPRTSAPPTFSLNILPHPLPNLPFSSIDIPFPSHKFIHIMSTRKRKQDAEEEEELQALPSEGSEEEEEEYEDSDASEVDDEDASEDEDAAAEPAAAPPATKKRKVSSKKDAPEEVDDDEEPEAVDDDEDPAAAPGEDDDDVDDEDDEEASGDDEEVEATAKKGGPAAAAKAAKGKTVPKEDDLEAVKGDDDE
ncbi:MAG: hypothetical protein Q9216_005946, partial [Gyalolechia sp. 2 TL-2023]